MKKSITIIILSVIIIISAVPLSFGFWAESQMNGIMEKMSASNVLDFTVIKQEKGWLSSTYDIAIELADETSEAYREYLMSVGQQSAQQSFYQGSSGDEVQPFTIVIRNVIKHGPFPVGGFPKEGFSIVPVIATIDTKLVSMSWADNTRSANDFMVPYTISSLISLTGHTISNVKIEPWNGIPEAGGAHLDWRGLNSEVMYDVVDGRMTGKISVPSFAANSEKNEVLLSDIHIDIDVTKDIQSISLGKMNFHVGVVKVTNQLDAVRNFAIEDCDIQIVSDLVGGNINSEMGITIKRLQSGKRSFGPGGYQLKLNNIDAESINKIDQQVKELQEQNVPGDQISMMMAANMFSVLPDFLAKEPMLEISNLSLDSDYGFLKGSGKISIDASNEALLNNPILLKEAIIANLEFTIPEELLVLFKIMEIRNETSMSGLAKSDSEIETVAREAMKNEMDMLVGQNVFIREDGNQYRIQASFVKGKLSLNGTEFNLPIMEGNIEQQPRQLVQ